MINFFRLLMVVSVIAIIIPQTPTENILLRVVKDTILFANYGKAEVFLNRLIWILIAFFLIITFFADFSYR